MTAEVYDLRGLKCPLPVLKTRRRLSRMPAGGELAVLTSDPMAIIDIPHFCAQEGHALLAAEVVAAGHRFVIRRGGEARS